MLSRGIKLKLPLLVVIVAASFVSSVFSAPSSYFMDGGESAGKHQSPSSSSHVSASSPSVHDHQQRGTTAADKLLQAVAEAVNDGEKQQLNRRPEPAYGEWVFGNKDAPANDKEDGVEEFVDFVDLAPQRPRHHQLQVEDEDFLAQQQPTGYNRLFSRPARNRGRSVKACGSYLLTILHNHCMAAKRSLPEDDTNAVSNQIDRPNWGALWTKMAKRDEFDAGLSLVEACCYQACSMRTLVRYCHHI